MSLVRPACSVVSHLPGFRFQSFSAVRDRPALAGHEVSRIVSVSAKRADETVSHDNRSFPSRE